ncbi:MAG TPA: triphosphoribosyl-dephospho-CoA synthase [Terrimicrobiaceae bacterium]|nr:triphosphoribosyl-dephospho-CoA synthase [Terrimicrobiaceae bacterium]
MTSGALAPDLIADCAAAALREELVTFPKPGLVSFVDNGSHPDMSAADFLASIAAITPGFSAMAAAAGRGGSLRELQQIGCAAEEEMGAATGGRNTHRGAIFCLGLLAAAAGRRHLEGGRTLGEIVRRCWGPEIPQAADLPGTSAGIVLCRSHRLGGVRREAAEGFPTVYRHGLPAFASAMPHGRPAARVQAFFSILRHCEDTTLLKRGGPSGLEFAREAARQFLAAGGVASPHWLRTATELHRAFVARNLTAGGAADLLAATLFIADIRQRS